MTGVEVRNRAGTILRKVLSMTADMGVGSEKLKTGEFGVSQTT